MRNVRRGMGISLQSVEGSLESDVGISSAQVQDAQNIINTGQSLLSNQPPPAPPGIPAVLSGTLFGMPTTQVLLIGVGGFILFSMIMGRR